MLVFNCMCHLPFCWQPIWYYVSTAQSSKKAASVIPEICTFLSLVACDEAEAHEITAYPKSLILSNAAHNLCAALLGYSTYFIRFHCTYSQETSTANETISTTFCLLKSNYNK